MNTIHVKVNVHHNGVHGALVPITVPDLADVRTLALRLHAERVPYHATVWGWPVYYEPELSEEAAEYEVPDGHGGTRTQVGPYWSPASFTIGESGVWFYSLTWERGSEQPPVEFLDDRNVV